MMTIVNILWKLFYQNYFAHMLWVQLQYNLLYIISFLINYEKNTSAGAQCNGICECSNELTNSDGECKKVVQEAAYRNVCD
jgi:hypothetical protein